MQRPIVGLVLALVLAGCFRAPESPPPARAGDFAASEAGAAANALALLDADGDERLDVVSAAPGGLRVVTNLSGARTDSTGAFALACACRALAANPADMDNDGDPDLLVLTDARPQVHRNEAGRFVRLADAALVGWPDDAAAAVWIDVDRDALLDLVFARAAAPPVALRNGNGSFGPFPADPIPAGSAAARAIGLVDLDSDGRVDILLGSDSGLTALHNANGSFEHAPSYTTATRARSFAVGDVDGSGTQDVVAAGEAGVVALANSRGRFRVLEANLSTTPARAAVLLDVDLDGDLDVVAAPETGGLALHRGRGDGTFDARASSDSGLPSTGTFRGIAVGDVDADGPEDVLAAREDGASLVLRNARSQGHWLKVTLEGVRSNRDGLGARLVVTGNTTFSERYALPGGGAATGNVEVVFGLGQGVVSALRIEWPAGTLQDHELPTDANRDRSVLAKETQSVLTWGEC